MILYTYWRSSAAYRVRIALNLKDLAYDDIPVHLVKDGGEHLQNEYAKINPQKLVPSLIDGAAGGALTQSLAIIEYLDDAYPNKPLLPTSALDRAYVRSLAQSIACEIHPLNNLRVLTYLTDKIHVSKDDRANWYRHWILGGFEAFESMLSQHRKSQPTQPGDFCFGDTPGLADCCLIPQIYNARRFDIDLAPFPTITRINEACRKLAAFDKALPENQNDAVV